MRYALVAGSALVALALVGVTAWLFKYSLAEAALLAPVIVVSVGATLAIVVLWTRIALDPLLRRRRDQI
jgi:hypothetical protein